MSNTLLDVTKSAVNQYVGDFDKLMEEHSQAMECRDCEDVLQVGIEAYKWLAWCEETFREAHARGIPSNGDADQALTMLLEAWLQPCGPAESWIDRLSRMGHAPHNLSEFREACDHVRALVEDRTWSDMTAAAFDELTD